MNTHLVKHSQYIRKQAIKIPTVHKTFSLKELYSTSKRVGRSEKGRKEQPPAHLLLRGICPSTTSLGAGVVPCFPSPSNPGTHLKELWNGSCPRQRSGGAQPCLPKQRTQKIRGRKVFLCVWHKDGLGYYASIN